MPELPEVETVARDLRRLVLGATITNVDVTWPRTIRSGDPVAFAEAVRGRRIEEVGRRAKLVTLELSGGLVLTIHLKMTGQLFVVPTTSAPDPYVRVTLELDDGRVLRFRDIRKFGRIGLSRRDETTGDLVGELGARGFKGFGPEPLDTAFGMRSFRQLLRRRKGRLKTLLTDQAFLAGIGNIYADEALWLARLHPLRSATSLRPPDEARLYRAIRFVLAEAVERRGSSIDDYTAPDGDGEMQERLQVYQRTGQPCPRCGRPIRRIIAGGRSTHFCSWCQRLPAPDRAGAQRILRSLTPPAGRGARWTELPAGEGAVGVDGRRGNDDAAARARAERTRRAAATRRATARGSVAAATD
jgi:formamidopyrimidine-DNA glycosylase